MEAYDGNATECAGWRQETILTCGARTSAISSSTEPDAHSPDLNPIERVWKLTRPLCTHNRYFPTGGRMTATNSRKNFCARYKNSPARKSCSVVGFINPIYPLLALIAALLLQRSIAYCDWNTPKRPEGLSASLQMSFFIILWSPEDQWHR